MKKKILVVDDSALMRRIVCDIIESDDRFEVADTAMDGVKAVELLSQNTYDAVVLDVVMPQMDGLTVLKELNKRNICAKVIMNSTLTKEGADITMQALEEGALEFVHKPNSILDARGEGYRLNFLSILEMVSNAGTNNKPSVQASSVVRLPNELRPAPVSPGQVKADAFADSKSINTISRKTTTRSKKLIAIASSTGGPKALQEVVPKLPKQLDAPVLIVQHMPAGFTASLAERLNSLSEVHVKEAADGDILENGHVYIAKGGAHMKVVHRNNNYQIILSDEPTREGVKPCANYMYESLADTDFDKICCIVMTGMGADATEGIINLQKTKKLHVIAQSEETCAVYGMPRSIVNKGIADEILPLKDLAQAATKNVGVQ